LAAKNNDSTTEIDRSTFDWIGKGGISSTIFDGYQDGDTKMKVPPCGACHPGGGAMEYARELDGTGSLVRLDAVDVSPVTSASTYDGDFYSTSGTAPANPFSVTGVIEADCLLCHMADYSFGKRFQQITFRNYKWAATVGAKLGSVTGAVYSYANEGNAAAWKSGTWDWAATPTVTYNSKAVDVGGFLTLSGTHIMGTPTSSICSRCHAGADRKKRGFIVDGTKDVHVAAGKQCLDCHGMAGSELDHNIGKGYARLGSVRQDLDGTIANDCDDCHGQYTIDSHTEFFGGSMHLNKIACQTCHIPYKDTPVGYMIDMSTGNQVWMLRDGKTPTWAGDFGKVTPGFTWRPFLKKFDPDGAGPMAEKYYPYGSKSSTWFGYVPTGKTTIQPFILKAVNGIYNAQKATMAAPSVPVTFADGTTGTKPNVSDPADIVVMLTELAASPSNPAGATPVFVSAEVGYELDGAGTGLVATAYENAESDHNFSIFHNIRIAEEALGANGCTDCHSAEGSLMTEQITDVSGFLSSRDMATNGVLDAAALHANSETMLEFAGFSEAEAHQFTDEEPSSASDSGSSTSGCFLQALELGE
jgi:hypothetical protein